MLHEIESGRAAERIATSAVQPDPPEGINVGGPQALVALEHGVRSLGGCAPRGRSPSWTSRGKCCT